MLKALLTDIDGTITDPSRRIHTAAITAIRLLQDNGVEVVFASGNTACFMDAVCKMTGTRGTFIAENGGVFRIGYNGHLHIKGDQAVCKQALGLVQTHYLKKGIELDLYSPTYRFADLAFARTVPVKEVEKIVAGLPVRVIDTGYAIHLQAHGTDKGSALGALAQEMNLQASDFLAIGDSVNDVSMLRKAGTGIAVANAHPDTKAAAAFVTKKEYGDGFVEAVEKYFSYLRPR
ncbi:MAG: phosphoglycolate phosphatase [Methanoregula sp.]|nr:MAG: phosphoglycolate phosphatase [Methanoregula sp.]